MISWRTPSPKEIARQDCSILLSLFLSSFLQNSSLHFQDYFFHNKSNIYLHVKGKENWYILLFYFGILEGSSKKYVLFSLRSKWFKIFQYLIPRNYILNIYILLHQGSKCWNCFSVPEHVVISIMSSVVAFSRCLSICWKLLGHFTHLY